MNSSIISIPAAVVLTGLVAGLFYGYDCSVIKGLHKLADKEYLNSFQQINREIQNPYFFTSFMGALLLLPLATWNFYQQTGNLSSWLLVATLLYWFGAFGITVTANVPLNNWLDGIEIEDQTARALAEIRHKFETNWNRSHHIRTLAGYPLILQCINFPDKVAMKTLMLIPLAALLAACGKTMIGTNGESIYKTGRSLQGENMLDRRLSQITIVKSCRGCHGNSGSRVSNIRWAYLSDPGKKTVPYSEVLFFRFLDKDLNSDGSPARTGVHWTMTDQDKADLLEYLKRL